MDVNFWKNRNVLVTGATGLLGSWLVCELVQRQANVTCYTRSDLTSSKILTDSGTAAHVNVVYGTLEDAGELLRALNEYEISSVFHLGAQTIVGAAHRAPMTTFETNIAGTWQLLEACRTCSKRVERIVVASTDKAYGAHDNLPYVEDMTLQGQSPYEVSKSCTDLIAQSYYYTYGVPVAITRCGNLYGGGDMHFNRLIPGTIQAALRNEAPIIRSDGKFVRDYFYVRDAVGAYLHLAEHVPGPTITGQAFNFSAETPVSVLELVDRILLLMGKSTLQPQVLHEASHEIFAQYLDCSKARTVLGWQPQYTLDAGLQETISWYTKNFYAEGTSGR